MHCCQSQNSRGVFHLLPPRNFSKFLDKTLSTSGSDCVKRIENRCPCGTLQSEIIWQVLQSSPCARTTAATPCWWQSFTIPEHIFATVWAFSIPRCCCQSSNKLQNIHCERVIYTFPASSLSALYAKTVAVLYLCRLLHPSFMVSGDIFQFSIRNTLSHEDLKKMCLCLCRFKHAVTVCGK